MPIYEYQCDQCGRVEEIIQKFSDKPLTKCEHCSGKLHKLISHSAFHLKGTGWYVTDYAGKTPKIKPDSSEGTSAGTSDTKSATNSKSSKNGDD
jgi:putative FmdB family regulatory protein